MKINKDTANAYTYFEKYSKQYKNYIFFHNQLYFSYK